MLQFLVFLLVLSLSFVYADNSGYDNYIGCYKDDGTFNGLALLQQTNASQPSPENYIYNAEGFCPGYCAGLKFRYAAMGSTSRLDCYCGSNLPGSGEKTTDSDCNFSCPGYPSDNCGGSGLFSVFSSGYNGAPPVSASSSSSSTSTSPTSSGSSSSSSTPTDGSSSSSPTSSPSSSSSSSSSTSSSSSSAASPDTSTSSSSPSGGVIAGVVMAIVVAIIALAIATFVLVRRKQGRTAFDVFRPRQSSSGGTAPVSSLITSPNDHYRRSSQQSNMTAVMAENGYNAHGPAGPVADQRLDPAAMSGANLKRNTSMAETLSDAEDYSRRILKVTNP